MFSRDTYEKRRMALKQEFEKGLILICGNTLLPMNFKDNTFNFIQDSTFLYYFGLNRENLFGVIDIDNDEEYIFGDEITTEDIIWKGPQEKLKDQCEEVGIENLKPSSYFSNYIQSVLDKRLPIRFVPLYNPEVKIEIGEYFGVTAKIINTYASKELCYAIAKQRNLKSPEEIKEIQKAVNITRDMHLEAMRKVKPGMKEYEVKALLENVAQKKNCTFSFSSICTKNGQVLHNDSYNNTLREGDLLLIDAGARLENGYCGDMTTTIPVSGKFSQRQKDVYNILIKMFDRAEELIAPGVTYKEIHLEVSRVLAEGLKNMKILKGPVDEIVLKGIHALFMPHGLGHMMGLDVHDMENFGEEIVGYNGEEKSEQFGLSSLRLGRKIEDGFVFTVEPGIYFIPELIKKWKLENKFLENINYLELERYINFGGMRYEGDFLATKKSSIRLGDTMPKYIEEIEKERNKAFDDME
ncbi:MAG: aminopeptidase P family protein [Fusobacterium sp.]